MLYLISGSSRSGKTLIAKRMLQEKNIPYLSLDWLMMGFNSGMPEQGIHHLLWPGEIARRVCGFLQGMIDNMIFDGMDYVLEGEAMLPELIAELVKNYPEQIKAVFLGFTNIDIEQKLSEIRNFSRDENDWLTKKSDEYIKDHISNMIQHSIMIKEECDKYGLSYVDTSDDFLGAMDEAMEYLMR